MEPTGPDRGEFPMTKVGCRLATTATPTGDTSAGWSMTIGVKMSKFAGPEYALAFAPSCACARQ